MIYHLRRRMIWISCTAVFIVFFLIYTAIFMISERQLSSTMDMMTDRISEGNGVFRPFDQNEPAPPGMGRVPELFTEETPFSTRFFTVWFAEDGEIIGVNLDSVSSVSKEAACEYALQAIDGGDVRGWQENYRYKIFSAPRGVGVVFVDGSSNRFMTRTLLLISAAVLIGSMVIIFLLIVLLSKRAVRPVAQSYEKQKQFITDAGHELKTPLTLLLTNLDILESELGHSEWLDDIRAEGHRMSALVAQLTALSRLDEDTPQMPVKEFSLSDVCGDTLSEFVPLIERRGLGVTACIQPEVHLRGDEGSIRRLAAILVDNAVKYCDPAGTICLSLSSRRQTELRIENTCAAVDEIALDRLFDRFYREDKARTAGSGFGIGLSMAKSIAEKHRGEIKAYKAGPGRIGFRVVLK